MAFRLTPPVFRREVRRRLIDVKEVQRLVGINNPTGVRNRVKAGKLPAPVLSVPRGYSFWDRDAVENFIKDNKQ